MSQRSYADAHTDTTSQDRSQPQFRKADPHPPKKTNSPVASASKNHCCVCLKMLDCSMQQFPFTAVTNAKWKQPRGRCVYFVCGFRVSPPTTPRKVLCGLCTQSWSRRHRDQARTRGQGNLHMPIHSNLFKISRP